MKTSQVRTKPFLTTIALTFLCIGLLTGCGSTTTNPKDTQKQVPKEEAIQEIFDGAGNTSGNYANGSNVAINDSLYFTVNIIQLMNFTEVQPGYLIQKL